MSNLHEDLQLRWVPSQQQVKGADALINAGVGTDSYVLTAHVLVNKEFGFWSERVQVEAVDGWFLTRDGASDAAREGAKVKHEATGLPCTGGYTYHRADSNWAVFEDILARFGSD